MNPVILTEVVNECERLLSFVARLQDAAEAEGEGVYYGSKHSAAVRRASLDLTRALAELRASRPIPSENP